MCHTANFKHKRSREAELRPVWNVARVLLVRFSLTQEAPRIKHGST